MKTPVYTTRFKREIALMIRRGKNEAKFVALAAKLLNEDVLEPKYRDHPLKGSVIGWRDCHVEPDWILIYKLTATEVVFSRTGTHSDLF